MPAYDRAGGCDGEGSDACPHPTPHTVKADNGRVWHFCDFHKKQWDDTVRHVHAIKDEAGDECECGQLLCPDTLNTVGYDPQTGEYWHLDGSTCFLHQEWRTAL